MIEEYFTYFESEFLTLKSSILNEIRSEKEF